MPPKKTGGRDGRETNKRIATIIASLLIVGFGYLFLQVLFLAPNSLFNMAFRRDVFNYDREKNLAFTYYDSNQFELAIPELKKLIELRPKEPLPYYLLGLSHARIGEPEKGIEFLNKAIELKPDMHQAHGSLASIYVAFGRDSAAKLNREMAVNYFRMADKAIEQALRLDSKNKEYLEIQKTIIEEQKKLQ